MKRTVSPWIRWRIVTHCALVEVPPGWTLSARVVESEGVSKDHKPGEVLTWRDSVIATLPVGLLDVRLRPGVHRR